LFNPITYIGHRHGAFQPIMFLHPLEYEPQVLIQEYPGMIIILNSLSAIPVCRISDNVSRPRLRWAQGIFRWWHMTVSLGRGLSWSGHTFHMRWNIAVYLMCFPWIPCSTSSIQTPAI
jgi:hypothetical protein